jgi:hypothetical protein
MRRNIREAENDITVEISPEDAERLYVRPGKYTYYVDANRWAGPDGMVVTQNNVMAYLHKYLPEEVLDTATKAGTGGRRRLEVLETGPQSIDDVAPWEERYLGTIEKWINDTSISKKNATEIDAAPFHRGAYVLFDFPDTDYIVLASRYTRSGKAGQGDNIISGLGTYVFRKEKNGVPFESYIGELSNYVSEMDRPKNALRKLSNRADVGFFLRKDNHVENIATVVGVENSYDDLKEYTSEIKEGSFIEKLDYIMFEEIFEQE